MALHHLKLQAIIILWGFTAILGSLIELSAPVVVLYRTGIAALLMIAWQRKRLAIPYKEAMIYLLTGLVIAGHWTTFFLAVKIANVSACMIGIATLSLWTAILEPLLVRKKRLRLLDVTLGGIVGLGVMIIFKTEAHLGSGLLVALFSAFLAALFSIFNSFFVKKNHHHVITTYEMSGAALFCALFIFFAAPSSDLTPNLADWLWLGLLSVFCTIVAYSQYIALLHHLSVFTINFASNLEPVYGILFAAIFFKEYESLNAEFWLGAIIIIASMILYPFLKEKPSP